MTVRLRVERGGGERQLLHTVSTFTERHGHRQRVLPGTRGRAGAQRVQRLVWTPVHAHGAAARVTHLSAST